jgi:prepilin signal peptidase PulO-like enzyme (type II secretory pathway)
MSNGATTSDVGPTSAIVSLVSLVISFFDATHIWLQNLTLLVSLLAGVIAIYAGVRKLLK